MNRTLVVLASGGLDSAALLGWASRRFARALPVFVSAGLRWEAAEKRALRSFLRAARLPRVSPPTDLGIEDAALYRGHWASSRTAAVPGARSADAAVELPGRNLLLLAAAAVFAARRGAAAIAIGSLKGNPFPDARPGFLKALERAASLGLGRPVRVIAPFRRWSKERVIREHRALPLERSLSCLDPRGGLHCGRCNKCGERKKAFLKARVADRTRYKR